MKYADLHEGMKIRATGGWVNCWKTGDEFVVKTDNGEGHAPMLYIECHHGTMPHSLEVMEEADGTIPEFEPVA